MNIQKILAISVVLLVSACGTIEAPDVNPTPHDMKQGPGLLSGKSGNLLDGFRNRGGASLGGVGALSTVNVYLWRAALDVLSVLPINQVDSAGGVILTDWAQTPSNPNERLKANVTLLGKALTPASIKVKLFKQKKVKGEWVEMPVDTATERQLEDAILTKARVLSMSQ